MLCTRNNICHTADALGPKVGRFQTMSKKGWTIGKTRSLLYKSGKALGDVSSVKRGAIGTRVTNRLVGKASTRISRRISKGVINFFK